MRRLSDVRECLKVTTQYPDYFTFDAEAWFSKEENYALIEDDNIAFAEYKSPGVYWVHFCYGSARGRKAIELTKKIALEFFRLKEVSVVIGLIELKNKKARWLIRQVGFSSLGEIDTKNGLCKMFILTKEAVNGIF